jgi:hypothetical protein
MPQQLYPLRALVSFHNPLDCPTDHTLPSRLALLCSLIYCLSIYCLNIYVISYSNIVSIPFFCYITPLLHTTVVLCVAAQLLWVGSINSDSDSNSNSNSKHHSSVNLKMNQYTVRPGCYYNAPICPLDVRTPIKHGAPS